MSLTGKEVTFIIKHLGSFPPNISQPKCVCIKISPGQLFYPADHMVCGSGIHYLLKI